MECKENKSIIYLGEKLKSKYLFNIQNDSDVVDFLTAKHNKQKLTNKKINKLLQ